MVPYKINNAFIMIKWIVSSINTNVFPISLPLTRIGDQSENNLPKKECLSECSASVHPSLYPSFDIELPH